MAGKSHCHLDHTHAINDLDFPNVTICPPKDSNTALYHDLVKAGSGNISLGNKQILREAATEIFLIGTHLEYSRSMLGTSYIWGIYDKFSKDTTPCQYLTTMQTALRSRCGT